MEDKSNNSDNDEKKEIKIVNGDGKDLNISNVYDHINNDNSTTDEKKKDIVIPKGSSKKK